MKIRVLSHDALVGFKDHGYTDTESNGGYDVKMMCTNCGHAWMANQFAGGVINCPNCRTDKSYHLIRGRYNK